MRITEVNHGLTLSAFAIFILARGHWPIKNSSAIYDFLNAHPIITFDCVIVGLLVSLSSLLRWNLGRRLSNILAMAAYGWLVVGMTIALHGFSAVIIFAGFSSFNHLRVGYGLK